ncbi:uncharacterized protein [Amphiura filiformis]|uniref:uncharacterized protein n=1 Tax=Amphiura filiformis TaxID=82378 RepID=UPI003B224B72
MTLTQSNGILLSTDWHFCLCIKCDVERDDRGANHEGEVPAAPAAMMTKEQTHLSTESGPKSLGHVALTADPVKEPPKYEMLNTKPTGKGVPKTVMKVPLAAVTPSTKDSAIGLIQAITVTKDSVTLRWEPTRESMKQVDHYKIAYQDQGSKPRKWMDHGAPTPGSNPHYKLDNHDPGKNYLFKVTAVYKDRKRDDESQDIKKAVLLPKGSLSSEAGKPDPPSKFRLSSDKKTFLLAPPVIHGGSEVIQYRIYEEGAAKPLCWFDIKKQPYTHQISNVTQKKLKAVTVNEHGESKPIEAEVFNE